jgi:Cu2+-containing amine oxidase
VRIPFDTEEHDMDYFNTIGGESGIDVYKDDEFFVKYDAELKADNLGILESVGINCVAIDINRIAEKYKFSNVEIKVNPENREQQVIDFIVAFDAYDYYTISYWYNIGCIAIHDDSGIYAQMFEENEDEEREKDRRQHEEN